MTSNIIVIGYRGFLMEMEACIFEMLFMDQSLGFTKQNATIWNREVLIILKTDVVKNDELTWKWKEFFVNLLKTKRNQSVPRSKYFLPRLQKPTS